MVVFEKALSRKNRNSFSAYSELLKKENKSRLSLQQRRKKREKSNEYRGSQPESTEKDVPHPCLVRQVTSTSSLLETSRLITLQSSTQREAKMRNRNQRQILGWARSLRRKKRSRKKREMRLNQRTRTKKRRRPDAVKVADVKDSRCERFQMLKVPDVKSSTC